MPLEPAADFELGVAVAVKSPVNTVVVVTLTLTLGPEVVEVVVDVVVELSRLLKSELAEKSTPLNITPWLSRIMFFCSSVHDSGMSRR